MNWTDTEDQFLRDNYNDLTAKRIARVLGCEPEEVYKRAYKLGLGTRQIWSRREDFIIRCMYQWSAKTCHRHLKNRTEGAVHARAHRLGLSKPRTKYDD
jgi:hypothetical protein